MTKVVGIDGTPLDIAPPDYKDAVKMLRNLAREIESGLWGDVDALVVVVGAADSAATFMGGPRCSVPHSVYLLSAALHSIHSNNP